MQATSTPTRLTTSSPENIPVRPHFGLKVIAGLILAVVLVIGVKVYRTAPSMDIASLHQRITVID